MRLQFSDSLRQLLEKERTQPLTLGNILAETSEHSFLILISLLALPFLFPMPPGITTVFGTLCLFLSAQMVLGRKTPWVPNRAAAFQLSQTFVVQLLHNLDRVVSRFEKVTRPRWSRFSQNSSVLKINGLCIIWLTLLLMLPVPFTNPLPALGILFLSISTLERDGLLMAVGYFWVGLNTALFGTLGYLIWRSPDWLHRFLA